MASDKAIELTQDIEELKSFFNQAIRPRVKDILSVSIRKLETDLITVRQEDEDKQVSTNEISKPASKPKTNLCYDTKITNYAWDQSDKFIKLYITLKDVHTEPNNVACEFTSKSMDLVVRALNGRNHNLLINNLMYPILPEGSYFKIKSDQVNVMLKKEKQQNWSNITELEKKAKESKTPKLDDEADPSHGLMDMMKKMYDEGDDEMKRTIAKAWTESREKGASAGFDM